MTILRYFAPRFVIALVRNVYLKAKYGHSIKLNPFKVYIEFGTRVRIANGGRIIFKDGKARTYITRGCDLVSSGGRLEIGAGVFFNTGCSLVSHESISVGDDVMFGPGSSVYDSDHRCELGKLPFRSQGYVQKPVSIGNNVWIGHGSIVTKGSVINDSVVVGAHSLVRGELEFGCLYGGNPIRKIRSLRIGCTELGSNNDGN